MYDHRASEPEKTRPVPAALGDSGRMLACRESDLEYCVHHRVVSAWRRGGWVVVSLVFHTCLAMAAVALGMMAEEPGQRVDVVQEVFFGSPGGDGSPGDGAAGDAGAAPAAAVQEAPPPVAGQPETPPVRTQAVQTVSPKRQAKPKPRPPAPAATAGAAQDQAAKVGQPGQGAPGQGYSAQGEGSGGGAKGGGSFEGEFGSGSGPRFAKRVQPNYPLHARRMGKEGVVVLLLRIDASGRLNEAEVVEKAGAGFDESALEAVRSSTYHPATWHGNPVPSRAILRIRFQLTAT